MDRSVYVIDTANAAFAHVRQLLGAQPGRLFGPSSAEEEGRVRTPELQAHIGPVRIRDRFTIEFGEFADHLEHHYATLQLGLSGDRHNVLVPDLRAVLEASNLGFGRTQLALLGHYRPHLGPVGGLEDALVGHRAVEELMEHVLRDVRTHVEAATTDA